MAILPLEHFTVRLTSISSVHLFRQKMDGKASAILTTLSDGDMELCPGTILTIRHDTLPARVYPYYRPRRHGAVVLFQLVLSRCPSDALVLAVCFFKVCRTGRHCVHYSAQTDPHLSALDPPRTDT